MQSFAGCSQTIVELTKDQKLISRVACRPPSGMYVSFQPCFPCILMLSKKIVTRKFVLLLYLIFYSACSVFV